MNNKNNKTPHILSWHFKERIENFHHIYKIGWYYKEHYLGDSIESIKAKSIWNTRKLKGRDIESPIS